MVVIRVVGKFVTDVAVPTAIDVVAAKQRDSDGGKKITPEERDDIIQRGTSRLKDLIFGLLPL